MWECEASRNFVFRFGTLTLRRQRGSNGKICVREVSLTQKFNDVSQKKKGRLSERRY